MPRGRATSLFSRIVSGERSSTPGRAPPAGNPGEVVDVDFFSSCSRTAMVPPARRDRTTRSPAARAPQWIAWAGSRMAKNRIGPARTPGDLATTDVTVEPVEVFRGLVMFDV